MDKEEIMKYELENNIEERIVNPELESNTEERMENSLRPKICQNILVKLK